MVIANGILAGQGHNRGAEREPPSLICKRHSCGLGCFAGLFELPAAGCLMRMEGRRRDEVARVLMPLSGSLVITPAPSRWLRCYLPARGYLDSIRRSFREGMAILPENPYSLGTTTSLHFICFLSWVFCPRFGHTELNLRS